MENIEWGWPWPDENTSPTRKRGVGIIPRLRVGLVLIPLVQLLAAVSSAQSSPPLLLLTRLTRNNASSIASTETVAEV